MKYLVVAAYGPMPRDPTRAGELHIVSTGHETEEIAEQAAVEHMIADGNGADNEYAYVVPYVRELRYDAQADRLFDEGNEIPMPDFPDNSEQRALAIVSDPVNEALLRANGIDPSQFPPPAGLMGD